MVLPISRIKNRVTNEIPACFRSISSYVCLKVFLFRGNEIPYEANPSPLTKLIFAFIDLLQMRLVCSNLPTKLKQVRDLNTHI